MTLERGHDDNSSVTWDASAIVLAGGRSSRLGRDKASEVLLGRTLLQRTVDAVSRVADEIVVVRSAGQTLPHVDTEARLSVVEDAYVGAGPLGGIYSGLKAITRQRAVTAGCDMPLLQPDLLDELLRRSSGFDAVVPVDGVPQALCAVYATSCLPAVHALLEAGAFRTTGLLDCVKVSFLEEEEWRRFDPEGLSFLNVNREQDLSRAKTLLERPRS
jgi:molybdopterin-guanine dinucleotide biosynthesis protein A